MLCARYNESLSEVAVGGPAPVGLEAHLAGCEKCSADLAALRHLLTMAEDGLKQLLTAEPSMKFVPRVRAALIESAVAPAWRRMHWLWPSLATAAALLMTLTVFVMNHSPRAITAESVPPQSQLPVAATATTPPNEPVGEPVVAHSVKNDGPGHPASHRSVSAGPEVLIPMGESQALMELITRVNQAGLAPEMLSAAGERSSSLASLPRIDIKPIEIVPLDPAMNRGT